MRESEGRDKDEPVSRRSTHGTYAIGDRRSVHP
jgi:hypothetical protein